MTAPCTPASSDPDSAPKPDSGDWETPPVKVTVFLTVLVAVFFMAFVVGRFTGSDAPGGTEHDIPRAPVSTSPDTGGAGAHHH